MFDPAARHAQISQQGDAARQAELILRDRRVLSLSLTEWREYLLLFSEEVVNHVDKLQQQSVPGELLLVEVRAPIFCALEGLLLYGCCWPKSRALGKVQLEDRTSAKC